MDSFVVPLLPAAQSLMSVASTNGRSLSLESIPLLDTTPLLRAADQPNNMASNHLTTHSSKKDEQSDTNISSSTESCLSEEMERKASQSTIRVSN